MHKKRYVASFLIVIILLIGGIFYSLPYYVTKPGMAKELEPIIKVENGYKEKGNFMLTTVRMGRANIYSYVGAKLSKYDKIFPLESILGKEETEDEYNAEQLYLMAGSKLNAIDVAYRKAGLPVNYKYKGIYVIHVVPGMAAEGKLQAGDRIFKVDGNQFSSSEQFIEYVGKKQVGDQVTLTYTRSKNKRTVKLKIQPFKKEPTKAGIGISLVDDKEIIVTRMLKLKPMKLAGLQQG